MIISPVWAVQMRGSSQGGHIKRTDLGGSPVASASTGCPLGKMLGGWTAEKHRTFPV